VRSSPKFKTLSNKNVVENDDDEEMDTEILKLFGEEPAKPESNQKTSIKTDQNEQQLTDEEINKKNDNIEHVYLASVSDDGSLRIWKPIESDSLLSLEKHNSSVNSICLNGSDMLATASSDKSINLWNIKPFFSKVSSGLHVVSSEKSNKVHLSEITSLVATQKHIISGSLDGNVFIWRIKYEDDNSTVAGIEYAYDIQAHDRSVTSIQIVKNESGETRFATCSLDNFIKVWKLKQEKHDQVRLILEEVLVLSKPVIFMETVILDNKTHLFFIESVDNSRLSARFLKCTSDKLQYTKGGFNISNCTSLVTQIKIEKSSNQLYINLLHDEILIINLSNYFKAWGTFILNKLNPDLIRISSVTRNEADFDMITNYSKNDKTFYTSVEYDKNEVKLIAGDSKGSLYVQKLHGSPIQKMKQIHTNAITELLSFELADTTSGLSAGRTLSASRDGFIRIWSSESYEQLGQFNNRSGGITKVIHLSSQDRSKSEINFVFGDQMGNINIIKWHESL
jgi:WD40 repeat protein